MTVLDQPRQAQFVAITHLKLTPLIHQDILQQPLLPRPLLFDNWPDELWWQDKATASLILRTQLHCPGVLCPMDSVVMIPRVTGGKVQNLTPRPKLVPTILRARSHDCPCSPARHLQHARQRVRQRVAGEAIRRQNQLAIRVEIDK